MSSNSWVNPTYYEFKSGWIEKNSLFLRMGWTESGSLNPRIIGFKPNWRWVDLLNSLTNILIIIFCELGEHFDFIIIKNILSQFTLVVMQ